MPATSSLQLRYLAHARSGDKGDTANVGLIALSPELYPILVREVTARRVAKHFKGMVSSVERFELPNLKALNFLLHGALDGGGTLSLKTDAQGKVFSTALLRMEINVPRAVVKQLKQAAFVSDGLTSVLEAGVLTLTLNRPDKRNALNAAVLDGLAEALARAELEPEIRVLAIRGAGKDFCAGADLDELLASADRPMDENERSALALGEVFLALRRLPKPSVAIVHGRALAGGAGLATACDIVLASSSSRFGYPEIERGFVPAMVMAMLRRTVGEKQAFDLVATGRVLTAVDALAIGLVSRVIPEESFDGETAALLSRLAGQSATAFALTKQLFIELDARSFEEGILLGARVNAMARATPDFKRAIAKFLSP